MRRISKLEYVFLVGFVHYMALCASSAYCQPVGEADLSSAVKPKQLQSIRDEPKIEFYNWLYGSSRRNWFEWHTITASVGSSLVTTGFRLRGMAAIGGYTDNIDGNESENILASADSLDDHILPSMGTVGKLYGMNGFGGLQFGYTYVVDNLKISGFVGGSFVKAWATASNMTTHIIKFSTDLSELKGTRYGILASIEGEYHPTDLLMFSAWGIYTPAFKWGYFEVKSGIAFPFTELLPKDIVENTYIGPHIALSISDQVRQPLFGGHLSGLKIGPIYMSVNAGYTREPLSGSGVYSILESSIQF